jgi:hypothetical protein
MASQSNSRKIVEKNTVRIYVDNMDQKSTFLRDARRAETILGERYSVWDQVGEERKKFGFGCPF